MEHTDRDANKLELHKVLERLCALTNNPLSRELARTLAPHDQVDELETMFCENREGLELYRQAIMLPVLRFPDPREHVRRVEAGGVLDVSELAELHRFLQVLRDFMASRTPLEDYPALWAWAHVLTELEPLTQRIDRTLDADGAILDSASKRLRSLRRMKTTLSARIKSKMEGLISSESTRKLLQDQLVTIRNNRYVVPLKAQNKGKIPGIVQDQSSSGSTLYVEPDFAVEMNNQLKQAELDEEEEVRRILRDISVEVAQHAEAIDGNAHLLAQIDFIMARASLSREMDATTPKLNQRGFIHLKQARHPLIAGRVVPNDIRMDDQAFCVVITGPNTGGKTVALKTLGILVLMASCGLDLPCEDESEVALFDHVFADIGDEQSIEQSLSTYSSHMTNIIRILRDSTGDSLVLLDELGAGTDPVEGAGLAASLLEHFCNRNTRVMATTHYGELKHFAYRQEGVVNASVEFDERTLAPTYRLLMGTPGLSNALKVASRLGLPSALIRRAEDYISEEEIQVSRMIQDLEDKRKQAEEMARESERLSAEVDRLRKALGDQERAAEEQHRRTMEKAYREAEDIVTQARREAEQLIQDLKVGLKDKPREAQLQAANEAREALRSNRDRLDEGKASYRKPHEAQRGPIHLGDEVKVLSLNQKGSVLALPNSKGEVLVQIGIMKTTVPRSDLSVLGARTEEEGQVRHARMRSDKSKSVSPEVDLRGMTVEEARHALDKYLDDALLAGLDRIRIIHGKGTGALQRFTTDYLRSNRQVAEFGEAAANEGGSGVTVARLGS